MNYIYKEAEATTAREPHTEDLTGTKEPQEEAKTRAMEPGYTY